MLRNSSNTFHAVIIGSGSIPIRCGDSILEKGNKVAAVVSPDADITSWAKKNSLVHFDSIQAFKEGFDGPVDFLFSVNNEHILTNDVLRIAQKCAINYHDALLPRYAGTHATSWALMNGESTHGITWHVIAERVDAGDILVQRTVDISADETALSLNAKCYEAAISAFDQLVDDLCSDNLPRQKQDVSGRSFFPRYRRPGRGGIISWSDRAEEISRLVRALDFGSYPNPLGKAKLSIEGEFYIVGSVETTATSSSALPGTIGQLGDDFLQVATSDKDVRIKSISTIAGHAVSIAELQQRYQLRPGSRLLDVGTEMLDRVESLVADVARSEAYWVGELAKITPLTAPYAGTRRPASTPTYRTLSFDVPEKFSKWRNSFHGENSNNRLLLAAFGVLVSRLTGNESFTIGYSDKEIARTVAGTAGLFADTLPLTFEVDPLKSIPSLIEELSGAIEEIHKNKTYPLDVSTRYPQLDREARDDADSLLPVRFVEIDATEDHAPTGNADLVLAASDRECRLIFNSQRLEEPDVERLSRNLNALLHELAERSDTPAGSIALMTDSELESLFNISKGKIVDFPRDKCIHYLLDEAAKKHPTAPAVVFDGNQLSHAELSTRSNQLARHLVANGVRPGALVAIAAERSIEMIVGMLGILKAGGAYIPVDPAWPGERLRHIASDTGVSLLVSLQKFEQRMEKCFSAVVCIDSDWEQIAEHSGAALEIVTSSESPVYVSYTSGSTGKPKGVLISHRSLVNHAFAVAGLYDLSSDDRVLQFAPFNFDVAGEEIFPTLLSGGAVVIMSREVQSSLSQFSEFLTANAISVVNLPTSYWREWTSWLSSHHGPISKSIRLVVTGSEAVYADDYNAWRKVSGSDIRWLNAYGLTESTITSIVFEPARRDVDLDTIPVGMPIHNTEIYILDKNMQPVPFGIPGELYIGGDGVAIGYLNLPDITAERFVKNPFQSETSERLYRTGDLVKQTADGNVEYLDRVDHQVKVRGFRIELGEIESVLSSHPELSEAVVVSSNGKANDTKLTAYFVCREHLNGKAQPSGVELWPSVGEYPVYDELMYYSMSTDFVRNSRYEAAIKQLVEGKVVVEIGTGQDLALARMCVAAGARKVYAIESIESAYRAAVALKNSLGFSNEIEVIHGFSTDIDLPEQADICLSEIIGTIGGSEGVAPILDDARRFLKTDGVMIPERCVTKIAAVQLPDDVVNSPAFSDLTGTYAAKVFEEVGCEFDVRVCLSNLPKQNLLSDSDIFEDLDFLFDSPKEFSTEITLNIKKAGRLDGFLLWINLHVAADLVIDSGSEKSNWLPVYFPAFENGIKVVPGDVINAKGYGKVSDNGINPDYGIKGELVRSSGETVEFSFDSYHHKPVLKQTPFYQKLFSPRSSTNGGPAHSKVSSSELREYLAGYLPNYMIPSAMVAVDCLPLTASGKIDRKALAASASVIPSTRNGFVAPKNKIERTLMEIWCDLLGSEEIGVNDNFFDLGGHSLLAIRMFTRVEETFRKSIPLATLFEAGTIEKLAQILRLDEWQEPESVIVPIQSHGSLPPLFCPHAKGGNVLFYRDLSKRLGDDQPFYGIQARRLGGRQVGHESVEEMAADYIKEIKRIQPTGPYFLGGASFGGLAAFEIAQQLHRNGEKVALLALFDTGTPEYPVVLPNTTVALSYFYGLVRRVQLHKESILALDNRGRLEYLVGKLAKVKLRYKRKVVNNYKKAVRTYYLRKNGEGSIPSNYIQMEDQISKAGEKYLPVSFPGKLTLFRASNQPLGIQPDPTLGWEPFVSGELEIHEVPGHHGSIVAEPYVKVLAEKLAECIQRSIPEKSDGSDRDSDGVTVVNQLSSSASACGNVMTALFMLGSQL